MVDVDTLVAYTGDKPSSLCHKHSKYAYAYLGNGKFSKKKLKDIEVEDRFKKEVYLFIEYLNKVRDISYSDISRNTGFAISLISRANLNIKACSIILAKYNMFVTGFTNYYKE